MKILSIKKVYEGFLSMLKVKLETSSGEVIEREVMSRAGGKRSSDAVAALVYNTKKDNFIFVKQFRSGLIESDSQEIVEVVAGTLEVGEDPTECMIREVEEEIGYKTDNIIPLGDYYVSPGGTTEKIYLYVVFVSDQISEGGGLDSEHEEIEIIEMSENEAKNYDFKDMKTELLKKHIYHNNWKN